MRRHLRRYMNRIPAEVVHAMALKTGWAGSENELLEVLRRIEDVCTDDIQLIPKSWTSTRFAGSRRWRRSSRDSGVGVTGRTAQWHDGIVGKS